MANQSNQKPIKRQFLFNPLKRPLPYIGLILAFIIIIFQSSIRQYTANLVGDWLVSNIRESTQGNYLLEYDFVRFDVFTQELRIQNLNLALDTTVIDEKTYLEQYSNLLNLSTPIVVLKLESLWDLIFHDKLQIVYVGIMEPNISLIRSENLSEVEIVEKQKATTDSVRSYLQELAIDSLRILNGTISVDFRDVQRQNLLDFRIRNFSTLLKGFHLDQIDRSKLFQGIYAEKFELEVLDQEIAIPKIHHSISFNRLWVSSSDSIVKVDTLRVRPLLSADSSLIGNLNLRKFELSGMDFRKAHVEEILDIENMLIEDPRIVISSKGLSGIEEKDSIRWNYVLFNQINIKNTAIKGGMVDINFDRKVKLNNLNLSLSNYAIDSVYADVNRLTEHISDFSMSLGNSTIEMPDSIHRINFEELHISSNDTSLNISNLLLSPIPNRRSYKLYKERGVRIVNYATIKSVVAKGLKYDQLFKNRQLLVDSILVSSPRFITTEYPYIKPTAKAARSSPYLINSLRVTNGSMKYNKPQGGKNHRTQFKGLNLQLNKVYNDENGVEYDDLHIRIANGFTEIKEIGHTLSFSQLSSNNFLDFDISVLNLKPDSASIIGNKLKLNAQGIRIRGFDRDTLRSDKTLKLDLVTAEKLSFSGDFTYGSPAVSTRKNGGLLNTYINRINLNNADITLKSKGNLFKFSEINTNIDSLEYSSRDTLAFVPISFSDLKLTHGDFSVKSASSDLSITGKSGQYLDSDSLLQFQNLRINSGKNIIGNLKEIRLKGWDRSAFTKNRALKFNYLLVDQPMLEIDSRGSSNRDVIIQPDSIKEAVLYTFRYVKFDSIITKNANMKISSEKRNTELSNISAFVGNYNLDTLTTADNLFVPKELELKIGKISTASLNDTVSVQNITLDMVKQRLFTQEIEASIIMDSSHLKANIPGVLISGFETVKLLNGDFSLDTIRLSNGSIFLTIPQIKEPLEEDLAQTTKNIDNAISQMFQKKSNVMFDTLYKGLVQNTQTNTEDSDSSQNIAYNNTPDKIYPVNEALQDDEKSIVHEDSLIKVTSAKTAISTHGIIKYISLTNSNFTLEEKENPIRLINNLKFQINIDQLVLDTINEFNIFSHIKDINLKVDKYSFNLPDSLNSISFDQFQVSTNKEQVEINGLAVTPRVSKYDYANIVGRQVTWQHLHDINVKIEHFNFYKIINDKTIQARKISTVNGAIDVFQEKVQPIPVNQRKPMPQEALKNIGIPILIDSVEVENFRVNFTSRQSPEKPEGSLNFHEINALATNIVNTDSAISRNPYTILRVSSNVMGKGLLTANFNFDMADENNLFIFDAKLDPMSAREFNSILEAMASVSIESGNIKKLSLAAQGDNYYAIGNMRFEYTDLKVSTINKKNLKTTGMGKVIKSFFANAFVVKKNNPTFKIFPREGAMYYERNPQKIIFDYAAKTAISGLISSIGGRNARKDIKKIQKESKKQKDEEKKARKKKRTVY